MREIKNERIYGDEWNSHNPQWEPGRCRRCENIAMVRVSLPEHNQFYRNCFQCDRSEDTVGRSPIEVYRALLACMRCDDRINRNLAQQFVSFAKEKNRARSWGSEAYISDKMWEFLCAFASGEFHVWSDDEMEIPFIGSTERAQAMLDDIQHPPRNYESRGSGGTGTTRNWKTRWEENTAWTEEQWAEYNASSSSWGDSRGGTW